MNPILIGEGLLLRTSGEINNRLSHQDQGWDSLSKDSTNLEALAKQIKTMQIYSQKMSLSVKIMLPTILLEISTFYQLVEHQMFRDKKEEIWTSHNVKLLSRSH